MFGKAKSRKGYGHEKTLKHSFVIEKKKKQNNRNIVNKSQQRVEKSLLDLATPSQRHTGGGVREGSSEHNTRFFVSPKKKKKSLH